MPGDPGSGGSEPLADGTYDAFIVDATEVTADEGPVMRLDLTITAGEHKGEMITVAATNLPGSELDLLGLPATLTVNDGNPVVHIEA